MAVTQTKTHGNRGMAKPNGARQARAKSLREPFLPHTPPSEPAKEYRGISTAWTPLPGTNPVPLTEITGCKWPVNESGPALFCNHEKPDHQDSYCATHAAMAKPRPTEATK